MDQRLPASVSRVPFSLSSAQRGSDPLGFCQQPRQKFSLSRDTGTTSRATALALWAEAHNSEDNPLGRGDK